MKKIRKDLWIVKEIGMPSSTNKIWITVFNDELHAGISLNEARIMLVIIDFFFLYK